MISIAANVDTRSFNSFRKKFGDTSNQALVRLGVAAAKEAAVFTAPKGRSKKKVVNGITAGAKSNVKDLAARRFNQITKKSKPAFKFRNGWVSLDQDQILRSPDEIYRFIEKHRNSKGRVKKLPSKEKAICKTADMNKTLRARRKLAGVAKGSWLGAGKALSKKSRGPQPARVGKNFMSWAQKHSKTGMMQYRPKILKKSEIRLISNARGTKDLGVFSRRDAVRSIQIAWKKTYRWYQINSSRRFA